MQLVRSFTFVALAAAIIAGLAMTQIPAQEAKLNADAEKPFSGSHLIVHLKGDMYSIYLDRATIKQIGGTTFIVGHSVEVAGSDWDAGLRTWIKFDEVMHMTEVPNLERFKEVIEDIEPNDDRNERLRK